MSTFEMMKWAWDLKGVDPLEKLVAIYFGGTAGGTDGYVETEIVAHDLAAWCGCSKEDAVTALSSLSRHGLRHEEVDVWLYKVSFGDTRQAKPVVLRSRSQEETLYLYVVSTASGVKIGITRHPSNRFKSLRTSSPEKMEVLFTDSAPRRIIEWAEARCHADLRPHHIHGEWFGCMPEMAVAVARAVLEEGIAGTP